MINLRDRPDKEPLRNEAKVEESRESLRQAFEDVKKNDLVSAQQNIESAADAFIDAYPERPSTKDALKFLDAAKQVLAQATGNTTGLLEAATLPFTKRGLQQANSAMAARNGSGAFGSVSQSWIFMQQAFPSGIPQDRLDNFFAALVEIVKDKAPHMIPIVEDIMLLRSQ